VWWLLIAFVAILFYPVRLALVWQNALKPVIYWLPLSFSSFKIRLFRKKRNPLSKETLKKILLKLDLKLTLPYRIINMWLPALHLKKLELNLTTGFAPLAGALSGGVLYGGLYFCLGVLSQKLASFPLEQKIKIALGEGSWHGQGIIIIDVFLGRALMLLVWTSYIILQKRREKDEK